MTRHLVVESIGIQSFIKVYELEEVAQRRKGALPDVVSVHISASTATRIETICDYKPGELVCLQQHRVDALTSQNSGCIRTGGSSTNDEHVAALRNRHDRHNRRLAWGAG